MNPLSRGNWASLNKRDKWRQKCQVTHEVKCTHTSIKSSQLASVMSKHQCNKKEVIPWCDWLFYVSSYTWQWKLEFTFYKSWVEFAIIFKLAVHKLQEKFLLCLKDENKAFQNVLTKINPNINIQRIGETYLKWENFAWIKWWSISYCTSSKYWPQWRKWDLYLKGRKATAQNFSKQRNKTNTNYLDKGLTDCHCSWEVSKLAVYPNVSQSALSLMISL